MPSVIMPTGQKQTMPYEKPSGAPVPSAGKPQPGGEPNVRATLVQALAGIKRAAEQQGLEFQDLLKEAAGAQAPGGSPPVPPAVL